MNYWFFPTLLVALAFFGLGWWAACRWNHSPVLGVWVGAGMLAALPATRFKSPPLFPGDGIATFSPLVCLIE